MMSKFVKVQYTFGFRLLTDYIAVEMCNISKATYFPALYDDKPALRLYRVGALHEDAEEYTDDAMRALLRWLDANSEALPGDGAADEQDEQSAIRRHFLALVSYCDDESDTATERAVQAIYRATRKALVHDGELQTAVPTHEMIERLEHVISECNQALNNMSLKPHIRKVYVKIMSLADGDELPEDAS